MRKFIYPLLSILALSALAPSAFAQAANANMNIGTSVPAYCKINGLSDIDFGTYTSSAAKTVTSYFYVQCQAKTFNSAPIKVRIDCGLNGTLNAGVCTRSMSNQTDATSPNLNYSIFRDVGYTMPWGDSNSSFVVDNGGNTTMIMYLRVPAGQNTPKKGSYLDQISVSLAF